MTNFKIEFATDNAAFDDNDGTLEVARILRDIADTIERSGHSGFDTFVRDINGNRIGMLVSSASDDEPGKFCQACDSQMTKGDR